MIEPQFPYSGSQAIISSNRVTIYSKTDGIFLFGAGTVGLSSPGTINLDSNEEVRVFSKKISLGANAQQQVVLGNTLVKDLDDLYLALQNFCAALSTINENKLSGVVDQIRSTSIKLSEVVSAKKQELSKILSDTTFTE